MRNQEHIILSATLEQAQAQAQAQAQTEALFTERCEQWLAENSEALDAYNQYVEAVGVFSDNMRSF